MTPRRRVALSGLVGVAGGATLTAGAVFLLRRTGLTPPISGLWTWALLAFLLFFSLAEIPVMIFGMRRMASSPSGMRLAVLINAAFTFFAAVYALPFLLLTGRIGVGVALAGLGLVRLAGALLFISQKSPGRSQ
jgi:hypothetical protein